ncbi:MAG: uridine kinase [Defluviitaleaceae bacterium]|nr:uridine kinase [Defluviitaleaceae bacterium]
MPPDIQTRLTHLLPLIKPDSIIAIDGRCGSGKSTIAALLAEQSGAGVIYMDDFFLPAELRTADRLATPGGNVHHERFAQEVLPYLRSGEGFEYRIFDCKAMDYNGVRRVAQSNQRIIEGAYSHHPVLGDYMDVRVFSDVQPAVQYARIKRRNGAEAVTMFVEKWIPLEEAYLRVFNIRAKADIIV